MTVPPIIQGEAIIEVLLRHGVDFVLIGGFAAVLQGSPYPTNDVDITPNASSANFARLSAALTELDAKVRAENTEPLPFSHDADSLAAVAVWNLATKYGDLDITRTPSGTSGFADLRRDAVTIRVRALDVPVASMNDIVRSKDAAARNKDKLVLPVLRELAAEETKRRADARRRRPRDPL
jgi:hypothetical protein